MRILTCIIAHNQRVHASRPVNTNSLAFLVTGMDLRYLGGCIDESLFCKLYSHIYFIVLMLTVLLLVMILNSHQMSPNFLVCV